MGLLEVGPAAAALFEICGWELAAAAPSTSLAPVVSMRSGESNKWAAAGGVDTIQSAISAIMKAEKLPGRRIPGIPIGWGPGCSEMREVGLLLEWDVVVVGRSVVGLMLKRSEVGKMLFSLKISCPVKWNLMSFTSRRLLLPTIPWHFSESLGASWMPRSPCQKEKFRNSRVSGLPCCAF